MASESMFEREKCGICGMRLTRGNCWWRAFPGICKDCAPDGVGARRAGWRYGRIWDDTEDEKSKRVRHGAWGMRSEVAEWGLTGVV